MLGEGHPRPDGFLDRGCRVGLHHAGDPEHEVPVLLLELEAAMLHERREVRMRQPVPEGQLGVQVGGVVRGSAGAEGDEDVGEPALRPDVRLGVGLAAVQVREDLVGRVAAARAVALDLPGAS